MQHDVSLRLVLQGRRQWDCRRQLARAALYGFLQVQKMRYELFVRLLLPLFHSAVPVRFRKTYVLFLLNELLFLNDLFFLA